jgi:hypothetical protein
MAYLDLLVVKVAAEPFGCLVLLDEGPYRPERERGKKWIYIGRWVGNGRRLSEGLEDVVGDECALVFARNIAAATITDLVTA